MRRLNCLPGWIHAHNTGGHRRSVPGAIERAQQLFFLSELCSALLQQHCLAALFVHHPAHAALAFAKTHWHSGERATKKHEHKEQGCESRLHLYSGTLMKTTDQSQQIFRWSNILTFPGKVYGREFTPLSGTLRRQNGESGHRFSLE